MQSISQHRDNYYNAVAEWNKMLGLEEGKTTPSAVTHADNLKNLMKNAHKKWVTEMVDKGTLKQVAEFSHWDKMISCAEKLQQKATTLSRMNGNWSYKTDADKTVDILKQLKTDMEAEEKATEEEAAGAEAGGRRKRKSKKVKKSKKSKKPKRSRRGKKQIKKTKKYKKRSNKKI